MREKRQSDLRSKQNQKTSQSSQKQEQALPKPNQKRKAPNKYRDEFASQAKALSLLGATEKEIADFFGVSRMALYKWKNANEEFAEALQLGKNIADANVVKSLYQKAISGDTVACIFWLKNRRRDEWKDRHDHDHSGDITVEVIKKF